MTTTQIIIAVCSFAIMVSVGLIVYIWVDAKKSISESVSDRRCEERRQADREHVDTIETKLCKHEHTEDGVVVKL